VKAHSPVGPIFPVLAREGLAGRSQEGESLPQRAPHLGCWGGKLSGAPCVCHHVAERASEGELGDELQSPCHHEEW